MDKKPLFDENEHYTEEANEICSEFNMLTAPFFNKYLESYSIREIEYLIDSEVRETCIMARLKKSAEIAKARNAARLKRIEDNKNVPINM